MALAFWTRFQHVHSSLSKQALRSVACRDSKPTTLVLNTSISSNNLFDHLHAILLLSVFFRYKAVHNKVYIYMYLCFLSCSVIYFKFRLGKYIHFRDRYAYNVSSWNGFVLFCWGKKRIPIQRSFLNIYKILALKYSL